MASSTTQFIPATQKRRGLQFWLIFISVCVSLFLSALEFTGLSTALPTIINDLQGENFVWVGSGYSLASTALLPLSGGLAQVRSSVMIVLKHSSLTDLLIEQVFGRKAVMISTLLVFALGSALCGAAQSMNWLIAARGKSVRPYPHAHLC